MHAIVINFIKFSRNVHMLFPNMNKTTWLIYKSTFITRYILGIEMIDAYWFYLWDIIGEEIGPKLLKMKNVKGLQLKNISDTACRFISITSSLVCIDWRWKTKSRKKLQLHISICFMAVCKRSKFAIAPIKK